MEFGHNQGAGGAHSWCTSSHPKLYLEDLPTSGTPCNPPHYPSLSLSSKTLKHMNLEQHQRNWKQLRPPGQCILMVDVAVFLHSWSMDENSMGDGPLLLIPLMMWNVTLEAAPCIKLPDPLPFLLRFKLLSMPCRLSFRLHVVRKWDAAQEKEGCGHNLGFDVDDDIQYDRLQLSHSLGAMMQRGMILHVRVVENPVFLRMKVYHMPGFHHPSKRVQISTGSCRYIYIVALNLFTFKILSRFCFEC